MNDIINTKNIAAELRMQYSGSRAAGEDARRMHQAGIDYSQETIADEPVSITAEQFSTGRAQVDAYLRLANTLAVLYEQDQRVQQYIDALLVKFQPNAGVIRQLLANSPIVGTVGARYGTDTVFTSEGKQQYLEVNMGDATGGNEEGIQAQEQVLENIDARFTITSELLEHQLIMAFNEHYAAICAKTGRPYIPLSQRTIALVENDGFYPGTMVMCHLLQKYGAQAFVVPREQLHFDGQELLAEVVVGKTVMQVKVDQLRIDFHLEADGPAFNMGDITQALLAGVVVAGSDMFTQLVLGSKATMGLFYYLANLSADGQVKSTPHPIISRLGAVMGDQNLIHDLHCIQEMFPPTIQWRRQTVSAFKYDLSAGLHSYFAKLTFGGTYGGHGVYDLREKNPRQYFFKRVRALMIRSLIEDDAQLQRFLSYFSKPQKLGEVVNYILLNNKAYTKMYISLSAIAGIVAGELSVQEVDKKLVIFESEHKAEIKQILGELRANALQLRNGFSTEETIMAFVNSLIRCLLYLCAGAQIDQKLNPEKVGAYRSKIIELFAAITNLPIVLQAPVPLGDGAYEIRYAGLSSGRITASVLSAATKLPEGGKVYTTVQIADKPPIYSNITDDPAGKYLEKENGISAESTLLELSLLDPGQLRPNSLVLMSGIARHAAPLIEHYGATQVTCVELSERLTLSAQNHTQDLPGVECVAVDAIEYMANLPAESIFDLITISGNSLIYLNPNEQAQLLSLIFEHLSPGGELLFDVAIPTEYAKLLEMNSGITASSHVAAEGAFGRIVHRTINPCPEYPNYARVGAHTSYITNGVQTSAEENEYYLPLNEQEVINILRIAGFPVDILVHTAITDDSYVGMMRTRYLFKATKHASEP